MKYIKLLALALLCAHPAVYGMEIVVLAATIIGGVASVTGTLALGFSIRHKVQQNSQPTIDHKINTNDYNKYKKELADKLKEHAKLSKELADLEIAAAGNKKIKDDYEKDGTLIRKQAEINQATAEVSALKVDLEAAAEKKQKSGQEKQKEEQALTHIIGAGVGSDSTELNKQGNYQDASYEAGDL